jgi:hypothetical protein
MRSFLARAVILRLVLVSMMALLFVGGAPARRNAAAQQASPVFSSSYTDLTKCGSGMTKKEEREAEKNGSDIPSLCKGYDGYNVYISYSACASSFSITKGEESISLGMQSVGWKQKTVEWRMANGKPFAVVMRFYEYEGDDLCSSNGKIKSESLMVRGLKGFEHIEEDVDARTPNANVKARELADKGFAKPKS